MSDEQAKEEPTGIGFKSGVHDPDQWGDKQILLRSTAEIGMFGLAKLSPKNFHRWPFWAKFGLATITAAVLFIARVGWGILQAGSS